MFLTVPAAGWLAAYQHHELLLGRGLAVLGLWALLNLLNSGYSLPRTDRRTADYHFHFMNCCWAFVNAVLAVVGILRSHPGTPPAGFDAARASADQVLTSYVFLVNAGLDVGYLLVAAWLLRRATQPAARQPQRLLGYGRAVRLQGGFLLAFDLAMYFVLKYL